MKKKQISVEILTEENKCSPHCPFFSLEPGASYERPFIERCLVFKKDLDTSDGHPYRCQECMERDLLFHEDAAKLAMEDACMGKEKALSLLRRTKYQINIYEYDSVKSLLDILMGRFKLSREYLKKLLGIDDNHLDLLINGTDYPYLIAPLRERLGFPKPTPMSSEEIRHQQAILIRRSERM